MTEPDLGKKMMQWAADLFPLHRSITGPGLRESLRYLQQLIPLSCTEVPTGTRVFDWTIPQEWEIRDAWIADSTGRKIVDYAASNLHIVSYSKPINGTLTWDELKDHVHTLPNHPSVIPYRTGYFQDTWGFCVTSQQYDQLRSCTEPLQVRIDSSLKDGALTLGDLTVRGERDDVLLLHTHTCHPSLANDNLSGILVATEVARRLLTNGIRHTVRLVFAPATIGAIAWLSRNEKSVVPKIRGGLVLSLLGSDTALNYKRSRHGDSTIDRLISQRVAERGGVVQPFSPFGYDERQYGSPGINLAVGCLSRAPFGTFPEYHTSADDLSFLKAPKMLEAADFCEAILRELDEADWEQPSRSAIPAIDQSSGPLSKYQKCEPFLKRHGLHQAYGWQQGDHQLQQAVIWVLSQADGRHAIDEMANQAQMPKETIQRAVNVLTESNLLETHSTKISA